MRNKGRQYLIGTVLLVSIADTQPCHAATPPGSEERVITGTLTMESPQAIQATRIRFAPGATVVTNGHTLTLQAAEIAVEDNAAVISFTGIATPTPGAPGRSAGAIIIVAGSITGGQLRIDNHGEDGNTGAPGAAGRPGLSGPKGASREWNPLNGCSGGSNGGAGGQGSAGGDGGPGGVGGNGGLVLISIQSRPEGTPHIAISAKRGAGGKGGPGGIGGPGGAGGDGADGTATCGGTSPGPLGSPGPVGRRGIDGQEGLEGSVLDLVGAIAPCPSPTPM